MHEIEHKIMIAYNRVSNNVWPIVDFVFFFPLTLLFSSINQFLPHSDPSECNFIVKLIVLTLFFVGFCSPSVFTGSTNYLLICDHHLYMSIDAKLTMLCFTISVLLFQVDAFISIGGLFSLILKG